MGHEKKEDVTGSTEAADPVKAEVGFVAQKVLVTFKLPVAVMINETAIFTQAVICEMGEQKGGYGDSKEMRIIGFSDGRKLTKSLNAKVAYDMVAAVIEL